MNFVVARPWEPDDPESGLCIYAYGGEIQQNGTMKEAKKFLSYVKRQEKGDGEPHKDYAIYEVTFTKKP